ncbi:MAG: diguanylate cyclase [Clostridiales bacterium]|nr:diguanylate cyclase [Clostridiales bacterium]
MEYEDTMKLLRGLIKDMPAFFIAADYENGDILVKNDDTLRLFGDIRNISEAGDGNTLLLTAGEKIGSRFEYNSNIGNSWYWISHYSAEWATDMNDVKKAEIFFGVDYMHLKNFTVLLPPDVYEENACGPINAFDRLEKQIREFKNGKIDLFSVCYVDIDGVKTVNETAGQEAGDAYVDTIIKVIKSSIRRTDIFIHIGGDDFLLIFPKCRQEIVENIMSAMMNKLDIINTDNDGDPDYSLSYGIMEVNDISQADVDTIIATVSDRMRSMKMSAV